MTDLDIAIKELNKLYKKDIVGQGKDKIHEIKRVHTGAASLDMIIGGGWPLGRIVELYGKESSGKTMLSLLAIREAQKMGLPTVFIDAEKSLEKKNVLFNNVDMEKLIYVDTSNGERVFDIIKKFLNAAPSGVIVVDSVSSLVPEYEESNEIGKMTVGLLARLMSKGLRVINNENQGWLIIFVNQIREKIGVMFGNPETTSGGRALDFFASLRIAIRPGKKFTSGDDTIGHEIKVEIVKSKVSVPKGVTTLNYYYDSGIDYYNDIVTTAMKKGLIERSGGWYTFLDQKVQGQENIELALKEDPKLLKKFEELVRKA